jgi:hypothetical protein
VGQGKQFVGPGLAKIYGETVAEGIGSAAGAFAGDQAAINGLAEAAPEACGTRLAEIGRTWPPKSYWAARAAQSEACSSVVLCLADMVR